MQVAMEEQRQARDKAMEEQQKAAREYREQMLQSRNTNWQPPYGVSR
jgi:hypothetical protein